jgi:UDP-4-amino-4,6-dideoxy-N-acetyl-beta-L-altrosamine transaminase
MIPYGRQDISDSDVEAVVDVLRSDWLTQGPLVPRFEEAVAKQVGAQYGIAVNSGTSALHIACLALGLGPGDRLWTSPNTFVASANCALYCGAEVDFVDIDPQTYNMSIQALSEKLEQADKVGKLPKILIPVHFAGQSCEMKAIHVLSKQYDFKIIEDACHAIGGSYQKKPIGCGNYSDITVFSFHPVKVITTGEGGLCVTNNEQLAKSMQLFRTHGITRDPGLMQDNPSSKPFYYEQIDLGFNYRMTDMQAALGLSQIQRLNAFIKKRQDIAAVYQNQLAHLPLILPFQHQDTYSAFHLYVVKLAPDFEYMGGRDRLFKVLREVGIGVNVHYIPVHMQPYYQKLGFSVGDFPAAEAYYKNAISLPIYPLLQKNEHVFILDTLRENLNE